MDIQVRKQKACDAIDACADELIALSHFIHDNPELGLQEYQASARIQAVLQGHDIRCDVGIGGLPTALKAAVCGPSAGPQVAFLAEYDALAQLGHACGHNIIAASAVGALLGAKAVMHEMSGCVSVFGTPAEETAGGKILLLQQGIFDGVDFALMIHPCSGPSLIKRTGRACTVIQVTFKGKAAHSSVPEKGINALTSAIATFHNLDMMRPLLFEGDNVNGIIREGGTASNVICSRAVCEFTLRADKQIGIERLAEFVNRSARSAAMLTGAEVTLEQDVIYAERYPNAPMSDLLRDNIATLGETMIEAPQGKYGSSDIGNISIRMPALHDYLSICENENEHSEGFARAAASKRGDEAVLLAAKGMAMTAIDLLSSEALREQVIQSYRRQVPDVYFK